LSPGVKKHAQGDEQLTNGSEEGYEENAQMLSSSTGASNLVFAAPSPNTTRISLCREESVLVTDDDYNPKAAVGWA